MTARVSLHQPSCWAGATRCIEQRSPLRVADSSRNSSSRKAASAWAGLRAQHQRQPDSGSGPAVAGSLDLPTQGQAVVAGLSDLASIEKQLQEILKPPSEADFLAEFLAIQNQQPRNIGFFGTRNMGFMHQQLIEVLAYAMGNHIFTSGATGTNAAVIRGALRAEVPDLLTVVLPQSLHRQPQESQELLQQVQNIVEMPANDGLQLVEASRICNRDIIGRVQQVICFAFHDSSLLLETCQEARSQNKIVTLFFLD